MGKKKSGKSQLGKRKRKKKSSRGSEREDVSDRSDSEGSAVETGTTPLSRDQDRPKKKRGRPKKKASSSAQGKRDATEEDGFRQGEGFDKQLDAFSASLATLHAQEGGQLDALKELKEREGKKVKEELTPKKLRMKERNRYATQCRQEDRLRQTVHTHAQALDQLLQAREDLDGIVERDIVNWPLLEEVDSSKEAVVVQTGLEKEGGHRERGSSTKEGGKEVKGLQRTRGYFASDLIPMMFGFGDSPRPRQDTLDTLELMVYDYITQTTIAAIDVARRYGRNRPTLADLLMVLRTDVPKFNRALYLVKMNQQLKWERSAFDFSPMQM